MTFLKHFTKTENSNKLLLNCRPIHTRPWTIIIESANRGIKLQIESTEKSNERPTTYSDENHTNIGGYATKHGLTAAAKHFAGCSAFHSRNICKELQTKSTCIR